MRVCDKICNDKDLKKYFEYACRTVYYENRIREFEELEDFTQMCYLALLRVKDDDFIKDIKPFCWVVARRECIIWIGYHTCQKRSYMYAKNHPSLDKKFKDDEEEIGDKNRYVIADISFDERKYFSICLEPLKKFNNKWYKTLYLQLLGYNYEEIEKIMGIAPSTVHKYLSNGKKFMREVYRYDFVR